MLTQTPNIRIPILDIQTFAGTGIPEDWQNWKIKSFRDIRAIAKATIKDRFIGVPVTGDSLKNLGIFHGDLLITKIVDKYDAEKIGVWQTPHGRTAKFAYEDFDGMVVLHNQNGWQEKWQPDEIKLVGIVVRVERDLE
jgi:SOS-response transcriptional repressor LexA